MRSLLWIVIVIIIYGSLFPFNFVQPDLSHVAWIDWGINVEQRTTNGDVLSNFLTFVPFGYFAFFYNPLATGSILWRAIRVLVVGLVLAYGLQFAQFFLPSRVPAVGDVMVNGWGIFLGIFGAFSVQYIVRKKPNLEVDWPKQYSIPLLLVVCWVLYNSFPFFPESTLQSLMSRFYSFGQGPYFIWYEWFFYTVFWFCFFDLLQKSLGQKLTYSKAVAIVLVLLLSKLFVANNEINMTILLASFCGMLLAFNIPNDYKTKTLLGFTILALLIRVFIPWHQKFLIGSINWIPLSPYLSGSMWVNTHVFLEKLFTFGCLIYYCVEYFEQQAKAIVTAFFVIAGIEVLQMFLSSGAADITDPMLLLILVYAYSQISKPLEIPVDSSNNDDLSPDFKQ